jgi:hypothetical protein
MPDLHKPHSVVLESHTTRDETVVTLRIQHRALVRAELTGSDHAFLRSFQRPDASISEQLLALETYVAAIERTEAVRSTWVVEDGAAL